MQIVIFGTGSVYRMYRDYIPSSDMIVAFLDNDAEKQGKDIDGIPVYAPREIVWLAYEKIVIMSDYAEEMKAQLLGLGCARSSIMHYKEYVGRAKVKCMNRNTSIRNPKKKSCLIITTQLAYHGGAMAAFYAALALIQNGNDVTIAATEAEERFLQEFSATGIEFFIYPNLRYAKWDELKWVMNFQKIIVNSYYMIITALEISPHHYISLWLHEGNHNYEDMAFWKDLGIPTRNINIYAVSCVAKEVFLDNMGEYDVDIMPFGIQDTGVACRTDDGILKFAVIGYVSPVKQQLLFLDVVTRMDREKSKKAIFFIVGNVRGDGYARQVREVADVLENVRLIDTLGRDEMDSFYGEIDVVVVPSIQETMSMVAVEAMMKGKVCIVSSNTGIADYIDSGINGFVCENGNTEDFLHKMEWCIDNRPKLSDIGQNARKTYEKHFTMQEFGRRLEKL